MNACEINENPPANETLSGSYLGEFIDPTGECVERCPLQIYNFSSRRCRSNIYECPYVEKEKYQDKTWKICIEYCGNRTTNKLYYTKHKEKDHSYKVCHLNKSEECPMFLLPNMNGDREEFECTTWCNTPPVREDGLCVRCPEGEFIMDFACVQACPDNMFNGTTTWC